MTATETVPIDYEAMRQTMVASQLRTSAVTDPRLVAAMARVPRERFMPAGKAPVAYRDTAVPLGQGRAANLPLATARLLGEARLRATDKVLLIGAASGYTAALLSDLVAHVVAVEVDPALAARLRETVGGDDRVTIVEGPLSDGHADGAPYDVLIVDGAVEQLPQTLVTQLHPEGRIVTGLVDRGVTRLAAGARSAGGSGLMDFADMDCVVLPGFAAPRGFAF